jgi:hypothetical protein
MLTNTCIKRLESLVEAAGVELPGGNENRQVVDSAKGWKPQNCHNRHSDLRKTYANRVRPLNSRRTERRGADPEEK